MQTCRICKTIINKWNDWRNRDDHCTLISDEIRPFERSLPVDICYDCWTILIDVAYRKERILSCIEYYDEHKKANKL